MIGAPLANLIKLAGDQSLDGVLAAAAHAPLSATLDQAGVGFPIELQTRNVTAGSGAARLVVAARDLRRQAEAEARIRHLALHDVLTGVANRALLGQRIALGLALAGRAGRIVAMLCIDLDRFKPINDLHGHAAGDSVLCEVSRRLQAAVRAEDTVARLGGDEFVILQVGVTRVEQVVSLATRLVALLGEDYDIGNGMTVSASGSIGIALFPGDGNDADTLLANADSALYRVKRSSRNGFALFQAEMDAARHQRHLLVRDLRRAFAANELTLAFQPQATCRAVRVAGFEALLRWHQPPRGWVSPADFIPVAEESALIIDIGAWVLRQARAEAATWQVPRRVAVNVSPRQLEHEGFTRLVAQTLAETGLQLSRLELEITEGLPIRRKDHAQAVFDELKRYGVRIALDDFGGGYSSLVTLRSIAFDRVKMDQTVVQQLTEQRQARAIVRAMIALGRALNIPVIAEGVETQAQLEVLRDEGCDEVQGYLLGRPKPVGDYRDLTHPRGVSPRIPAEALMPSAAGAR